MGSTGPFLGNTVIDVCLPWKCNTVPLDQEDRGKMGKAANSANGSKIKKREDKLHMEKRQLIKKTKKGKPVTCPSENALEMTADLREERLMKNQHSVAADMHAVKISDLQANMTNTGGKKLKNWHKKTEKGKPVTNPSEYAAEMPADLGKKRPEENQRSLSANVQITKTSDLQANRIDRCSENPKDHKKTEKEELVTSPIENIVEMPIDFGKVGAPFRDPQVHAEREPSGLNWTSSNPGFPHGIIQSTVTATIGQAWQASANVAINPLKRRHDDQDAFDSPRFKKRRVWDLAEWFEALSI